MRHIHTHPESCIRFMRFEYSDGGRRRYLEESPRVEQPTGDCAVVAMVHAFDREPTADSYRRAISDLWDFSNRLAPWTKIKRGETVRAFVLRRIRECLPWNRSRHKNPIHGTLTPAYAELLRTYFYGHIFELGRRVPPLCICSPDRAYVLEGYTDEDAHVTAVWNGVIQGTCNISELPFRITNIWQMDPLTKASIEESRRDQEEKLRRLEEWLQELIPIRRDATVYER